MRRARQACLTVVALGMAFGVGRAGAQVSTFGWSPNAARLTADDWSMLWDSVGALNKSVDPHPGESHSWTNSQSGNSGTVTLERIFRSNDMPCHALRYSIVIATEQTPRTYDLTWCQTEAGEWKMAQ